MVGVRHDFHSHAREGDVPGTVDLRAKEGEETHYGQALFPVPSADPNDPLQWPRFKKHMILFCCASYSFLANSALLGPSVYLGIFSSRFGIDANTAAGLINYPNLVFGFGSLVLVPMYRKFGRRPIMLLSLAMYAGGLIGAARATTFGGLMGARLVHGIGSSVCEALPTQLVNDVFFLHERGNKLGWYTAALCLGATGPMFAGFMLAAGYSYDLFFYVEFAFAGALLLLSFFFVEETRYDRSGTSAMSAATVAAIAVGVAAPAATDEEVAMKSSSSPAAAAIEREESNNISADYNNSKTETADKTSDSSDRESTAAGVSPDGAVTALIPRRRSFAAQLLPFGPVGYDASAPFFMTIVRAFTYLLVPSTLWVITTYGLYIGLCALSFNFVFPIKIVAPPYNWSAVNSGLNAIGTVLGYALALPFVSASDRLAAWRTKRNGGVREAEMRLGILFPALVVAPAGLVLFGLGAQLDLHWVTYFFGVAMTQWAAYFYFTVSLAYAVDSYTADLSEMLIIMNIGKQLVSFGLGLQVLNWILEHGYARVLAGAFTAVLLANNLVVFVFIAWGKKIRIGTSRSWLAEWHARTATVGESH